MSDERCDACYWPLAETSCVNDDCPDKASDAPSGLTPSDQRLGLGMTPLEKEIISTLSRNPGSTANQLAKYLSIGTGYASQVLLRLCAEGMVSFKKERFRNGFRRLWTATVPKESR